MPCPECPETPDTGCLHPITTECVTYNGNDIDCANISSGQSLNQVIEQLAENDCDLKEQIKDIEQNISTIEEDISNLNSITEELSGNMINNYDDLQDQINNIYPFSCEDLSGCTLDDLSDVSVEHVSGDILMSNGINWVNYTPEEVIPYQFTCEELSGCTLDELSGIEITNPVSGDVVIHNGTKFINSQVSSVFTASNGLTKSGVNTKLGGTLEESTTINIDNRSLLFYEKNVSSLSSNSIAISAAKDFITGGEEATKTIKSAFSGGFGVSLGSNFTPCSTNKHGVFSGTVYKDTTFNWLGKLPVYFAEQEHASSGDTTWAIAYLANPPSQYGAGVAFTGTITNAVGLYIEDINASNITSKITNKYAIYQKGASDISIFFGEVQNAGGVTQFTSDARIKENIQEYTRGLSEIEQINTKTFNYTYKKDKPLVGIIAQELENIIPEAVKQGNFETPEGESYSDFRMIDQNYLIYTLINAVKELSQKVKQLENGIE